MNIYFDESGNSGQNLLDKEQPIYVLVSHNFTAEEAKEILSPIETTSDEIHFKKIKRYSKYHGQIESILNNDSINYDRIKIAYYNKKFALCAHLVDQLVETAYYHNNIPYYENGFNIAYAQSLFLQTEFFESKSDYLELITKFQKMIRFRNQESITSFYEKAFEIFEHIKDPGERNFFYPILVSQNYIDSILKALNKFSIDLALPSLTLLSDIWFKNENVKIDIIHDDSKQVDFWREFILYLSKDITKEKQDVGFDERKMTFPLQINSVKTVDSRNNVQIQLSDLIASSFSHYAKNILLEYNETDKMANIISNTKLVKMNVHPLQPDLSFFEKEFTNNVDDINPLDFLALNSLKNRDKFNDSYPR